MTTAAEATAVATKQFGLMQALEEGGPISWAIFLTMVVMSAVSWYIMFTKLFEQNKIMKQYKTVQTTFWRAASLKEGAAKLEKDGAWRQLADDAVKAQEDHGKMTDALESHDYMHGSLQRSEDSINSVLAGGLPFLATVGATSPFVGLLGTTMGIVNSFTGMATSGAGGISAIAAGVAEALITTAIGIGVAIPAVWAFNFFQTKIDNLTAEMTYTSKEMIDYLIKGVSGEFGRSRFTREFNTAGQQSISQ